MEETENGKTDMFATTLDVYGLSLYSCKQCDMTKIRKSAMVQHIQRKHQEKTEECDICGMKFSTQSPLRAHKDRVHLRKLNYECFVCQKGFFDKTGLKDHLIRIHENSRKTERTKIKYLPEHLKVELQKIGKVVFEGRQLNEKLVCNHCNKIFQTERYALIHAGFHTNERKTPKHHGQLYGATLTNIIKSENIEPFKEKGGDTNSDLVVQAESIPSVMTETSPKVLETCQKRGTKSENFETVVKEDSNDTKSSSTKKADGFMVAVKTKQHIFNTSHAPQSLNKSETVQSYSKAFFFICKKCQSGFNSSKMLKNHRCSQKKEEVQNEMNPKVKVVTISDHKNKEDIVHENKENIVHENKENIVHENKEDIVNENIEDSNFEDKDEIVYENKEDIVYENNADKEILLEPETETEKFESQRKEDVDENKKMKGKGSRGPYKKNLQKALIKMERMEYKQKKAIEAMKKMEEIISKEPGPEPTLYNFICDLCKRGCQSQADLAKHKKSHEEDPTLPCPSSECTQTFVKKNILSAHMLKDHGLERDSIAKMEFSCESCDYKTEYRGSLKTHMVKHSTEKPICSECGKNFNYHSSLETHMKMHRGLFDFPCLQCDSKFISKLRLKAHETAKHTNQSFICEDCGKEFRLKQGYTTHMTLHTGTKPHRCREGCDKQFRHYNHRDEHELKHRGIKTRECKYCGKTFMTKNALRVHEKRHEGRREHLCLTCGRGFVEPAGAKRCRHSQAQRDSATSVKLVS